MPAKKKIADLPRKALKARKAAAVKGGRKQTASGNMRAFQKARGPGNFGSGN
jgi:hypothetical protein